MEIPHGVALTETFERTAAAAGMTDDEIDAAIDIIAKNPMGGSPLGSGTRKVRIPTATGGKRGGYRIVTYYVGIDAPVYLISVLSKRQAANFTAAALTGIRQEAKSIKKP